jgi:adenylate cyclase
LKPEPTKENCLIAKDYALNAASLSEKANNKVGMAISYEQLTTIFKVLDYQIHYIKWKAKAALLPRGAEMKQQQEQLEKQQEKISNQQDAMALQEKEMARRTEEAEKIKHDIALLAGVLFNLYKTKTRTAKELAEKNVIIQEEKKRSDELLLNILPLETANELKLTGKAVARQYDVVTVMLTDFKDFTIISEKLSPKELVDEIDLCFSAFDNIIAKYGIEKIKTIGDAYLCAHGIPGGEHDSYVMIKAAQEIIAFVEELKAKRKAEGRIPFSIRIGINTGPLVAGVVGKTKFAYDIWGDTVNTAARMEQNSEPGKINVSKATYDLVKDKFKFEPRGKIEAKNKGEIEMFFLNS